MFERIEDCLDYVHDLLELKRGDIGFSYVSYADETLLPKYPAAVVAPGETTTRVHTTHYFMRRFTLELLILHANMTKSRAIRTREDLQLATRTVEVLSVDPTCGGEAMFSYCPNESPLNIVGAKNQPVIGTHLVWEAEARVAFK